MAGRHQIRADVGQYGGEDGAGAVGRRNAGITLLWASMGHREVGAELGAAVTLRQRGRSSLSTRPGPSGRHEAAGVFRQEINGLGRLMLAAMVMSPSFSRFAVDKNDHHPALPDILHRFFNTAKWGHSIESSASLILRKAVFAQELTDSFSFSPPRRRGRVWGSHHVADIPADDVGFILMRVPGTHSATVVTRHVSGDDVDSRKSGPQSFTVRLMPSS